MVTHITFSYIIHKDGRSISSHHDYKFALKSDFDRGWIEQHDFHDPHLKGNNDFFTHELDYHSVQYALDRINHEYYDLPVYPAFTRGNQWDAAHPINKIHQHIDFVIDRKKRDPGGWHYIRMALFDFDNKDVAHHLAYAAQQGVDIECIADWAAVSSMNCSENVADVRRAGIPVYGLVRNTPCVPSEGIASMHTKIIIFDDAIVHSSSYNLHFHLWGGNWENGLVYQAKDFALLYLNIYHAIRGGVIRRIGINPFSRYNLYYSFGSYYTAWRNDYRPQDAIITEINNSRHSVLISMFDIGHFSGVSAHDSHETDVIDALINAKNRGAYVKLILNGMITHSGPMPEHWDKDYDRPLKEPVQRLKDAGIDIVFIYYWESIYSPLHHKFAVFDDNTVITESYNWYAASLHSDEVISVIRDRRIAHEFTTEANLLCQSFRLTRH